MKKLIIFVKKYGFFCDYGDLNVTPPSCEYDD